MTSLPNPYVSVHRESIFASVELIEMLLAAKGSEPFSTIFEEFYETIDGFDDEYVLEAVRLGASKETYRKLKDSRAKTIYEDLKQGYYSFADSIAESIGRELMINTDRSKRVHIRPPQARNTKIKKPEFIKNTLNFICPCCDKFVEALNLWADVKKSKATMPAFKEKYTYVCNRCFGRHTASYKLQLREAREKSEKLLDAKAQKPRRS